MRGHPLHDLWGTVFATFFAVALYDMITRPVDGYRRIFYFAIALVAAAAWYGNRRQVGAA